MDITKIDQILCDFINNSSSNAILIDGPWGCGKTHQVNEAIKKYKKEKGKNILYISLFGLESIDEINTNLYYQIHKKRVESIAKIFLKTIGVVSKAIPAISPTGELTDALDNQLGNRKKNIKGNYIIVFDDLERVSLKVTYENLLGYINNLFMAECRIVCLASSENMNSNRKKSYNIFKEKVFDCIYTINNTNEEIMNNIFSPFNIDNIQSTYHLLDNNFRIAKKVSLFFEKVLNLYREKSFDIKYGTYDNLVIFEAAIYTIKITLQDNIDNDINMEKEIDKDDLKIFGENIAYGIYKYFKKEKPDFRKNTILFLVRKMLHMFCFLDTYELENALFPKRVDNKYEILNKTFYYLSQDNKVKYKNLLEEYILSDKFNIKDDKSKVGDVINYSSLDFSDEAIIVIAQKYIAVYGNNRDILFDFHLDTSRRYSTDRVNDFKKKMYLAINNIYEQQVIEYSTTLCEEKDYKELTKLINEISQRMKNLNIEKINNTLVKNDFFLPDLKGDINHEKWDYCHTIAKYVFSNKLEDKFKEYCVNLYLKNPDDYTLKERLLALINFNIDVNFTFEEKK